MTPRPPLPPGPYLVVGLARSGQAAAALLRARGEAGRSPSTPRLPSAGRTSSFRTRRRASRRHRRPRASGARPRRRQELPGSPPPHPSSPLLASAASRSWASWSWPGAAVADNEVIAVTGTNGKTTTVELLGHLHREAGVPGRGRRQRRHRATRRWPRSQPGQADAIVVCEASSFQLEDTHRLRPRGRRPAQPRQRPPRPPRLLGRLPPGQVAGLRQPGQRRRRGRAADLTIAHPRPRRLRAPRLLRRLA